MKTFVYVALSLLISTPAFAWEDVSLRSAAPVKIIHVVEPVPTHKPVMQLSTQETLPLQMIFLNADSQHYDLLTTQERIDAHMIDASARQAR